MGMNPTRCKLVLVATAFFGSACTEKNPNLCCNDQASCDAMGISIDSKCADGLICRGNSCVAETCTTSDSCEGGAPFCAANGLCSPSCETDAECPGFGGDPKDAFCDSGVCDECRVDGDCTDSQHPICDAHACRGCGADSECDSQVCGANGACVSDTALLYVDSAGFDGGDCTSAAPCKTLTYAATRATPTRSAITMTVGSYSENVVLDSTTTSATELEIHGHGATIVAPSTATFNTLTVNGTLSGVTVSDLSIVPVANQRGGVGAQSPITLHNVTVRGGQLGLSISGGLTATNVSIIGTGGVSISGQLKADGMSLISSDMTTGFYIAPGTVIDVTNLVVAGGRLPCLTLGDLVTGTISNATIADCGTVVTAGPAAIKCGDNVPVVIRSSIVWAPGSTLPGITNCDISNTSIGPVAITGASSADPLFTDFAAHNFRLQATSPAIDAVPTGPATDILGTARPQGSRYDLGAYEFKP